MGFFIHSLWQAKPRTQNVKESSSIHVQKESLSTPQKSIEQNNLKKEDASLQEEASYAALSAGSVNVKLKIVPDKSLYEILQLEENKKLISFKGKEYTGIGFFVTNIGSLDQDDGKYLMYYVNGIEASSGISNYIPKEGDVIEWKLK